MAIAFVQGKLSITASVTFDSATTTGNTVVVCVTNYYSASLSVSDNYGNTYLKAVEQQQGSVGAYIFYCLNATGGAGHQITLTNAGGYRTVIVAEFSDIGSLDSYVSAAGSATNVSTGDCTVSQAGTVVVGIIGFDGARTVDTGTNFTQIAEREDSLDGAMGAHCEYQLDCSSNLPATWTISSIIAWATAAASFAPVGSDTTPPTLSSPNASADTATTATIGVTTDENNGTLYAVVTTSSSSPSKARVKAGQDHTGAAAVFADDQAISSSGAKTFSVTGLTSGVRYYAHFMHEDAATNQSDVSTSASFTQPTVPATPVELAVGTITSSSIALSWTDNADDETGFKIQYATEVTFASPTTITIASADDESETVIDLAAETTYYFRVCAYNDAGDSDWSNVASGETKAEGAPAGPVTQYIVITAGELSFAVFRTLD